MQLRASSTLTWPWRLIVLGGITLATLGWSTACGGNNTASPKSDASEHADTAEHADTVEHADGETQTSKEEQLQALETALCPGYAARHCAGAVTCGCGEVPGYPTREACEARMAAQCATLLDRARGAVLRGEAEVRLGAVAACLETLEQVGQACLGPERALGPCGVVAWVGVDPGAAGASCAEAPCAAGLVCGSDTTCVVPGGTCTSDADCVLTERCKDERCWSPNISDARKSCEDSETCGGDTECIASGARTCERAQLGDACGSDDGCPPWSYCAFDEGGQAGTCVTSPAQGEPCGSAIWCAEGLACVAGLCAPKPGRGDACAMGPGGPVVCAENLSCIDGLCASQPVTGEACAMGAPACAPGLGCSFEEEGSFCRPPGGVNSPCGNDSSCVTGLFCDFTKGRCAAAYATGVACSAGNECGPAGACLPDANFDFRCQPAPGLGDACFLDECGPELRCLRSFRRGTCAPPICLTFPY